MEALTSNFHNLLEFQRGEEDYNYKAAFPAYMEMLYGGKTPHKLNEKAKPYTTTLSQLKENHPLMIIINEERWVIH